MKQRLTWRRALLRIALLAFALGTLGGPAGPGQALAATSSFTISISVAPPSVSLGGTANVTARVTSAQADMALVLLSILGPSGGIVFPQFFQSQSFTAGQSRSYTATWQVPTWEALGTHTAQVSVTSFLTGTTVTSSQGGQFTVVADAPSVTATPTTGPSATATPQPSATATPTPPIVATNTPTPTASPTATPSSGSGGHFNTLAPGSALPSGSQCASMVRRSSWEPRPDNATANQTTGAGASPVLDGVSSAGVAAFQPRIDGNFTGTTDEIIQWGACKWGRDEDIVRATAVHESWWRQSTVGNGGQSFGLLQINRAYHTGTYPYSANSTAFNVDYSLAWWRSCFEGYMSFWLPSAARGDDYGCGGVWFDGTLRDAAAQQYISTVQGYVQSKPWLQPGF